MDVRLGQLLIEQGVLSADQVSDALEHQAGTGEPLGLLCERMFGVPPEAIERAWAAQYARLTRTVDPDAETFEDRALGLITRRQAWQFRILPIRFDGDELMIATTQTHLRRALRFAVNVIGIPVFFVMTEEDKLGQGLCRYYELPGFTPGCVGVATIDRLLGRSDPALDMSPLN